MKNMIEIVNPIGEITTAQASSAVRRPKSLQGLRIGLLDNNKPNADRFLAFVGAHLKRRNADIKLVPQRKMTRLEADGLTELAQACDVVINAFAD